MNLLSYTKMPFSFNEGWDELGVSHPSMWKTFLLLVLPFSLIPPAMMLYAGSHHPSQYLLDAPFERWQLVASVFLVAELLTVPLIGWIIRKVAAAHNITIDLNDAFRLAAITAVPMWLSALAMAIPSLWAMIGVIVLGLLVSASVLYHGAYNIMKMTGKMEAQALSAEIFSVGGLAWVFLCAFVVLPLMN